MKKLHAVSADETPWKRNFDKVKNIHPLQKKGWERFLDLGFPTTKLEDWKYTSVKRILDCPNESPQRAKVNLEEIKPFLPFDLDHPRIVFVNGFFDETLSNKEGLPQGVDMRSLAQSYDYAPVKKHLGEYARIATEQFVALNTAFLNDGLFLHIPKGIVCEKPIQCIHFTTQGGIAIHPRLLVVAEENSEASLVDIYAGHRCQETFTNPVHEVVILPHAHFRHVRLNMTGPQCHQVFSMETHLSKNSVFTSHSFIFGGGLVRNNLNATLDGEGITCTVNGIFVAKGKQHIDIHSLMDHAKPHCDSREFFKGMLSGDSRGVFNGKIIVRPDAQKTNAFQSNRNIILSKNAHIDTKPQLEIYADDVKCSHGATIGQLDDDAKFYLRSRGISEEQSNHILIHAFASEIVNELPYEPLRWFMERELSKNLDQGIVQI